MEMTEGEKKWYKTGIQVGIEALLNRRWVFVEAYTRRGIKSKEDLRQFFKDQKREIGKIVGDALAEIYRRNGWAYARCEECGYVDGPGSFLPSMSAYHDLKCPKCGTTHYDIIKPMRIGLDARPSSRE